MNGIARKWALALVGILLCGPAAAEDEPKPVVVVFDIEMQRLKVDKQLLDSLSDYLSVQVAGTGLYQVVPRADLKSRLTSQKAQTMKECYDQSCQIELGRELAAQLTVTTKIAKLGSACHVSLALFDLRTATTERAVSTKGACDEDGLVQAIQKAVVQLAGADKPLPTAGPARAVPQTGRTVQIMSAHSGKCLHLQGGSKDNSTPVLQHTCKGKPHQLWRLDGPSAVGFQVVSVHSGKCLDVEKRNLKNGAPIQQYRCTGKGNQRFGVEPVGDGTYKLVAAHSGKCLHVEGKSMKNSAAIIQYACNGKPHQLWRLQSP